MTAGAAAMWSVAAVVLAGCTPIGDSVTEAAGSGSVSAPSGPVDPWTLPLEQRPPLYDACAELPPSALDTAGLPGAIQVEKLRKLEPGKVISCGFTSDEVKVSFTTDWSSASDVKSNPGNRIVGSRSVGGRTALVQGNVGNTSDFCAYDLFTARGAILVQSALFNSLSQFRGKPGAKPCEVVESVINASRDSLPGGDFS